MNATEIGGPVIAGWSAVSPFGVGAEAFEAGLRAGRPALETAAAATGQTARMVPDFDARTVLGKKGTRSMDRVTALAVTAVGQLDTGDPSTALVLGTNGSAHSVMSFTRSSMTEQQPFYVDPARFPNTVMNCASGQCAIWYRLTGPNATIAGDHTAALLALSYARRLQRSGRAGTVLCGGADEYSEARSWLHHHNRHQRAVLGEGCAMLRLEPAGTTGLAEVAGLEFGAFGATEDIRPVLADVLRRVLRRTGVAPKEVWAVAPADLTDMDGVRDGLDGAKPTLIHTSELIGDTSAASVAFQICAVLATAGGEPAGPGRVAVVTAVDPAGTVGAALLRLFPDSVR